ncbi:histidine kinase N-terminal domain-containing protein [Paenibacillus sp. BR2-3]|uniref:sensor histidine kinase n=1 Tax=Paenibacillus sp. BR2-3 TaxID=3048494 RepID=UPI003977DDFD
MNQNQSAIRALCEEFTNLSPEDIPVVENLASQLDVMADLSQGDVFIDCLSIDGSVAIVIAHGKSSWSPSLYKKDVVGAVALPGNEPGVFEVFRTGRPITDARGLSQEDLPIRQRVVPIQGVSGDIIAVLIQEQDITEQVERDRCIESLEQSNAYLVEMMLEESLTRSGIPDLFEEGIVLVDNEGAIRYANERGKDLLNCGGAVVANTGEREDELRIGERIYTRRLVPLERQGKLAGKVVLLRDRTEMKDKERELRAKSVVLREIRHRVENHMQTIISLLRLQQRRQQDPKIAKIFEESLHRIEGVARIHRFLSREGSGMVEAGPLLKELVDEMLSSMVEPEQPLALEMDMMTVKMDAEQFAPLALIVNELLQNTVKHAPNRNGKVAISVSMRRNGREAELIWEERTASPVLSHAETVLSTSAGNVRSGSLESQSFYTENGKAAGEGEGSLGLILIIMLAEETLGGGVRHDISPGLLRMTLTFPLEGQDES